MLSFCGVNDPTPAKGRSLLTLEIDTHGTKEEGRGIASEAREASQQLQTLEARGWAERHLRLSDRRARSLAIAQVGQVLLPCLLR
jgi:DNA-binding MarR family transcriptional regulator